jgi:hypothetical protein
MDHSVARRIFRVLHPLTLAVIGVCVASAQVALAKLPEPAADRVRLFEWFSTLGFPDVKNARFVRYPHGFDGKPLKVEFEHGFLIGESKDEWTVLTCDIELEQVTKRPPWPANLPAGWTHSASQAPTSGRRRPAQR